MIEVHSEPFTYYTKEKFFHDATFAYLDKTYPYDKIYNYAKLEGTHEAKGIAENNYVLPLEIADYEDGIDEGKQQQFYPAFDTILDELPKLKKVIYGKDFDHDSFYVNYHHDLDGSFIETHNDLKDFRWLVTCQIYFDYGNQGAWTVDKHGEMHSQVPQKPNFFYAIPATNYSWHCVDDIVDTKRSILFRFAKRRHRSVLRPSKSKLAFVIDNTIKHSDKTYIKMSMRMGNLTEAWLASKDCENIFHTKWKDEEQKQRLLYHLIERGYDPVVIPSGCFPDNPLSPEHDEYIVIKEKDAERYDDMVFRKDDSDPLFCKAEEILEKHNPMEYEDV